MRKILCLAVPLLAALIVFGGCSNAPEEGLLQGIVSVGPLTPVITPGQDTTINCQAYSLRKIMVYDESGQNLIKQVDIDCSQEENFARYQVKLEPGTYTIDINHLGVDFSKDVPEKVEIQSGLTTRLDIDIDTGIR